MTGILEQISAQLSTVSQQLTQVLAAAPAAGVAQPQFVAPPPPPVAAMPPAVAPAVAGAGAYSPASAEMITALITPYVENPHIKAALQAQMAALGIGALPDAQPHQYGELYARFQGVIQQFGAQQAAVPQPVAPPSSII